MTETKFDSFCGKISAKWQRFIDFIYEKFTLAESTLTSSHKINTSIIAILCVFIFVFMLFVNSKTPLILDDYPYNFIFLEEDEFPPDFEESVSDSEFFVTGEKITSINDIIKSMTAHYKTMNGRVVLHFIVQLMMLIGKPVFNVLNSFMYVIFLLLVYKHCIGKAKKSNNAVLFVLICVCIWTFNTSWGQFFVWMDGSINYLWSAVIRLTVLLAFRLYADDGKQKRPVLKTIFIVIGCAIAGATNENTSAAFIGMICLFMIYYRVKKFKIPAWSFLGLISALAGFAFMCLAPGNSKRTDSLTNSLLSRIINIPMKAIFSFSVFLAIFLILAMLLYLNSRKDKNYKISIGVIYIIGAFGGAFVMIAASYFPERAWFGLKNLCIIAVGCLVYQLKLTPVIYRQITLIAAVFWSVWAAISCAHFTRDAINIMNQHNERIEHIEEQKRLGNFDVYLAQIESKDERSPFYQYEWISAKDDKWQNKAMAKYYGLNSITLLNDQESDQWLE